MLTNVVKGVCEASFQMTRTDEHKAKPSAKMDR